MENLDDAIAESLARPCLLYCPLLCLFVRPGLCGYIVYLFAVEEIVVSEPGEMGFFFSRVSSVKLFDVQAMFWEGNLSLEQTVPLI